MLRRRSLWRKVPSYKKEDPYSIDTNVDHASLVDILSPAYKLSRVGSGFNDSSLLNLSDISSNSSFNTSPTRKLRSAMSSNNLLHFGGSMKQKDTRSLRFSSTVRVCLIPNRADVMMFADDLYWATDDYNTFKAEAVKELRHTLSLHGISAKAAINLLYQPSEQDRKDDEAANQSIFNTVSTSTSTAVAEMTAEGDDTTSSSSAVITHDEGDKMCDDISLPFINNIKTDLEMNKEVAAIAAAGDGNGSVASSNNSNSLLQMPMRTPSHGNANAKQAMWAVKWIRQ